MTLLPFPAESRMRWRRLDVPGREEARVVRTPAGWRLDGTYTREAGQTSRYQAWVDGEPFAARLDTDRFGRVVRYEGSWEAEPAV